MNKIRYQKIISFAGPIGETTVIVDTETGNSFLDNSEGSGHHYDLYRNWLAEGNEPEVIET